MQKFHWNMLQNFHVLIWNKKKKKVNFKQMGYNIWNKKRTSVQTDTKRIWATFEVSNKSKKLEETNNEEKKEKTV